MKHSPALQNISNSQLFDSILCAISSAQIFWSAHFIFAMCKILSFGAHWCVPARKKTQEKDAGANKPISSARSQQTAGAAFPAQNHNMKYISAPLAIKKRRQQQPPSGAALSLVDATARAAAVRRVL